MVFCLLCSWFVDLDCYGFVALILWFGCLVVIMILILWDVACFD